MDTQKITESAVAYTGVNVVSLIETAVADSKGWKTVPEPTASNISLIAPYTGKSGRAGNGPVASISPDKVTYIHAQKRNGDVYLLIVMAGAFAGEILVPATYLTGTPGKAGRKAATGGTAKKSARVADQYELAVEAARVAIGNVIPQEVGESYNDLQPDGAKFPATKLGKTAHAGKVFFIQAKASQATWLGLYPNVNLGTLIAYFQALTAMRQDRITRAAALYAAGDYAGASALIYTRNDSGCYATLNNQERTYLSIAVGADGFNRFPVADAAPVAEPDQPGYALLVEETPAPVAPVVQSKGQGKKAA